MEYTRKELIDFACYLTGHDLSTIDQMFNDYTLSQSINSSATKARAVRQNEQAKEVSFSCNCTWPSCNHLTNCRNAKENKQTGN